MELIIRVDLNGDAFQADNEAGNPPIELSRIVRKIAGRILCGNEGEVVRDINGNLCGEWMIEGR